MRARQKRTPGRADVRPDGHGVWSRMEELLGDRRRRMEQFVSAVGRGLKDERFRLLDIGCAGGIDHRWRTFGPRLQALGIDASAVECRRLATLEQSPDVSYLAAFVSGSAKRPFDASAESHRRLLAIFDRLSVRHMLEIRSSRLRGAPIDEKVRHNVWDAADLADAGKPVSAPDLLAERGWTGLDYLKIDVDGADFEILRSFDGRFDALGVLAVELEVNFVGTGTSDEHSFHNTDAFMRRQGFELFRLDNRTYSTRALPARFTYRHPAQTVSGRVFQGDAFYARDPAGGRDRALAAAPLLKLAAIFSAWELPDCAAEILTAFGDRLAGSIDVDEALDRLAAQIQAGESHMLSYREYMAEFSREAARFFPPTSMPAKAPVGPPTFRQRLRAAWAAYRDWVYADDVEAARRASASTSSAASDRGNEAGHGALHLHDPSKADSRIA